MMCEAFSFTRLTEGVNEGCWVEQVKCIKFAYG